MPTDAGQWAHLSQSHDISALRRSAVEKKWRHIGVKGVEHAQTLSCGKPFFFRQGRMRNPKARHNGSFARSLTGAYQDVEVRHRYDNKARCGACERLKVAAW